MNRHEMAKELGRRGGQARARRLTAAQRTRIASLGGVARRRSLETARRIADTLVYAVAARELRGQQRPVARVKTFAGPLPGIYRDTR